LEAVTEAYDLIPLINPISLFHMEAVVAVLVVMVASMIILVLQAAMEAMVSAVPTYIIRQWILLGFICIHKLEDHF
jgi:hypothetical protein